MKWALALGWLLTGGLLAEAPPIDFNSPFNKTALIESRMGQWEEFEILKARLVGENLEMTKADGSILLSPQAKVTAILPKIPPDNFIYAQQDAQKALVLLEKAAQFFPNRPETAPQILMVWRELANRPSSHERNIAAERSSAVQRWLDSVRFEEEKLKPADLEKYIQEGEQLAKTAGPQAEEITTHLSKARDLMAMDLEKILGKELPTDGNEFSGLIPVGLAGILLILTLWILANLANFLSALKTGMVRSSGRGGGSRITFSFGGVVYLLCAGGGLGLLFFLLRAQPAPVAPTISDSARISALRGLYLSMNAVNQWSNQAKSTREVEAAALIDAVQPLLPAGEFRNNKLLSYQKPLVIWCGGKIFWRQTLMLSFVPIQMDFRFLPPERDFSIEGLRVESFYIGSIPFGAILGNFVWGKWSPGIARWDQALGLQGGAAWSWGQGNLVRIETPVVIERGDSKKQTEPPRPKKIDFKSNISAADLARIFTQGDGAVYKNRTINLTGNVVRVISNRRLGNTTASEVARKTISKSGGPGGNKTAAPSGQEDFPDEFYLSTGEGVLESKVQIKVTVKCPNVYYLDSRGDLYKTGTNPNLDTPVVARQKQALFKGGRVEGMERDVIEIYGAQPPEEVP